MLHEGISEAGAMASATAAGSTYSTHGEHMIPFYIFYSMFGFQRTGDSIWAMADQLARGFLIGATAGRTTLTGEGLQHADGHSPLLAATNPAVVHYDPAFAYEVSHVMQDGLRRMYGSTDEHPHGEDVIFYMTVYNEPVDQPAEPDDVDVEGILRGIHHVAVPPDVDGADNPPRVQLLASRCRLPVDRQGPAAARRGLGRRRRHLVGHLVERAGPRRDRRPRSGRCCTRPRKGRGCRSSPTSSRTSPVRSSRSATTCAPYRSRSTGGCRRTTTCSAPTGSASPTPGRPPAGSSTSTPSRSWCRRCRRWPSAARSRPRRCRRRSTATGSTTRPRSSDVKQEGGDA